MNNSVKGKDFRFNWLKRQINYSRFALPLDRSLVGLGIGYLIQAMGVSIIGYYINETIQGMLFASYPSFNSPLGWAVSTLLIDLLILGIYLLGNHLITSYTIKAGYSIAARKQVDQ